MARPQIKINKEQLEEMAFLQSSKAEIANYFGISEDTIHRRYAGIYKKARDRGKYELRKLQWEKAKKGDAKMQMFLGEHWLGQNKAFKEDPSEANKKIDELLDEIKNLNA